MKLMRWVEVHIGRSRRKSKKDRSKDGLSDGGPGASSASPGPKPRLGLEDGLRGPSPWSSGDMTTSSPNLSATLYRWKRGDDTQELDDSLLDSLEQDDVDNRPKVIETVKSIIVTNTESEPTNNNNSSISNLHKETEPNTEPSNPTLNENANLNVKRPPLHIRTSFQESSAQDIGSPRQRSRIKTNPWIPSPRSSCSSSSGDSGWSGTRSSGSDSPETAEGFGSGSSVFGSQSSGTPWGGWSSVTSLRSSRDLGTTCQLPSRSRDKLSFDARRVTSLERRSKQCHIPWVEKDVDQILLCGAERLLDVTGVNGRRTAGVTANKNDPRSRSLPRVEWEFPTEVKTVCPLAEGDSSEPDEAYSEDFVQSEDPEEDQLQDPKVFPPKEATSPQADSACSCSTTPLSEVEPPTNVTAESLDEKVRRLRTEQRRVEEKMREAREDEQRRREERLVCQQELIHFRRLLLLRTLQELRNRLEMQGERLHRAYSATLEMKQDWQQDTWPAYD